MLKKRTKDSVVEVYRRMLAGERLEDIKAPDDIKNVIRTFLKHSDLSAYKISQTTDLTSDVVGALRNVKHGFEWRSARKGIDNVPFAVKWILAGWKPETLKLYGLDDETIKLAKKCIKILDEGGKTPDLYKAGVSRDEILSVIRLYESKNKEKATVAVE